VADLVEVLAETRMSAPKATTASGTLLRAKMHSRRVG
jgi:hypothetical protein